MNINLTEIVIENFRCISKIKISLLTNSQGLEKDVELNGFKYIDNNKHGLPPYVAIFGRNAIGKTAILEAIMFVANLYNGSIEYEISSSITHKYFLRNNLANSTIPKIESKRLDILMEFRKELNEKFGKFYDMYANEKKNFLSIFYVHNSYDRKNTIKFSFNFYNGKKNINLFIEINSVGDMIEMFNNCEEIEKNRISKYLASIVMQSFNVQFSKESLSLHVNDRFETSELSNIFVFLKSVLGVEKLNKVMQLADPIIEKINFRLSNWPTPDIKSEDCNSVAVKNGEIQVSRLSSGTKRFAFLLSSILANAKNCNSLVLIDEIEFNLHKELVDALKILMVDLFRKKNIQFIFTTHSPLSVHDYTSFKQIISITKNENGEHLAERLSTRFKQHQNIINRYLEGSLAPYPDSELARNIMGDLID